MDKGLKAAMATTVPVSSSPTTMSEGFGGSRPAAGDTSITSDGTKDGSEYDSSQSGPARSCSLEGSEGADPTPSKRATQRHSQNVKNRVLALIRSLRVDPAPPASYPDPRPGKPQKPYCRITGSDAGVQYIHMVAHATHASQLTQLEYCFGFEYETFNTHTRWNLVPFISTAHDLIDKKGYILLPELDVLEKSRTLVKNVLERREHNTAPLEGEELEEHVCNVHYACVRP